MFKKSSNTNKIRDMQSPSSHPLLNKNKKQPYKLTIEIIGLLTILAVLISHFSKIFPKNGILNNDAFWTYLPNAKKFLENPWIFLTTDPASYYVAPLGYIWPALFNANQKYIQLANIVLFIAAIVLIWLMIRNLAGSLAAFISISILVIHPDLKEHAVQVQTEAMYLFGLSLALFGIAHGLSTKCKNNSWVYLLAAGLAITLLNRPVLQYLALLAFAASGVTAFFCKNKNYSRKFCIAILLASIIPLLVIIKNGYYFNLWSIGTGSGTGLYYGLSPNKLGAEPVFSNFIYDAHAISLGINPKDGGNPLSKLTDEINKNIAIEILKQTSLTDNLNFLFKKFKMWLFTSTPELYINPLLRNIRAAEWLIIFAFYSSLASYLIQHKKNAYIHLQLPGNSSITAKNKLLSIAIISIFLLLMAAQLSPVLYNTRYSSYFIAPFTAIITGIAASYLTSTNIFSQKKYLNISIGIFIIIVCLIASNALTKHNLRREAWSIDSKRPGPTALWIASGSFNKINTSELYEIAPLEWSIENINSMITIDFQEINEDLKNYEGDAIWRIQFSLATPSKNSISSCEKVLLSVDPNQSDIHGYTAPAIIFIQANGQMHDYMISANGTNRPKENSKINLTFNCPKGTILRWKSIELRRSTMTESAINHIKNNQPINLYFNNNEKQ